MKRYILFFFVATLFSTCSGESARSSGNTVDDKSGKNNHGKFDNGKAKRVASKDKPFGKAMEFK